VALGSTALAFGDPSRPSSPTNIFAPASTPAKSIFGLSLFVLAVTGAVFLVVFSLLLYSVVQFRKRKNDDGREPPQVYGSNQVEMAWTIIPILIVVALFMATARVIALVQRTSPPMNAIAVTAIGHQFWWEYRYPQLGAVTANELHLPVSDPAHPTPTFIQLLSADTDHSFWVPRLGGKTDLIPNHPNTMWIDPQHTGVYLGQCAQYCGTQHAKMLLRKQARVPSTLRESASSSEVADPYTQVQGREARETSREVSTDIARSSNCKSRPIWELETFPRLLFCNSECSLAASSA
jgi:cytochrome c oxidase subunit II